MGKNTTGLARGSVKGRKRTGGRAKGTPNKVPPEVKALCQQYGPMIVQRFVEIVQDSDNEASVIAAGKELLDRGYGKAKQEVETSTTQPIIVEIVEF